MYAKITITKFSCLLSFSVTKISQLIYLMRSTGSVPGSGVCGTVLEDCSCDAGSSACVQMILLRSSAISASCRSSFRASFPSCRSA